MSESRFGWYEKVRIASADPAKAEINGELWAVLGKAESEGRWSYGVFIYSLQVVWSCLEDELIPTGEFDQRETFYSGQSIRVSMHGEVLG